MTYARILGIIVGVLALILPPSPSTIDQLLRIILLCVGAACFLSFVWEMTQKIQWPRSAQEEVDDLEIGTEVPIRSPIAYEPQSSVSKVRPGVRFQDQETPSQDRYDIDVPISENIGSLSISDTERMAGRLPWPLTLVEKGGTIPALDFMGKTFPDHPVKLLGATLWDNRGVELSRQKLLVHHLAPGQPGCLLVVGSSGGGKSTCVRSQLASVCYLYSPAQYQFYVVELEKGGQDYQAFKNYPHCLGIISDTNIVSGWMRAMMSEYKRRQTLLAQLSEKSETNITDIEQYNRLAKEFDMSVLPILDIIVDEHKTFVDLSQKDPQTKRWIANMFVDKIARTMRYVGMVCTICTQYPTADVIERSASTQIANRVVGKLADAAQETVCLGNSKTYYPRLLPAVGPKGEGAGKMIIRLGGVDQEYVAQTFYLSPDDLALLSKRTLEKWAVKEETLLADLLA